MFGCGTEFPASADFAEDRLSSSSKKVNGATQVDGIGYFDAADDCGSGSQGATFAVSMTGDLEGCLFVFVEEFKCNSSGAYYEKGSELFVGTYKGEFGTFRTTYVFTAKYEGCAEDGSYLGLEIFGRCQHPIVKGSGDGVFTGVSGRLDMKDDIEEANYPYRGHLKF
ncbi:hypothetical protein [Algoriphagus sp. A40]|uniref:hypothetical protein n=1 Tax=Algoriphagus sp. A40 TaxID=1945863 RepID=UPI0011155D19|nr:hypothetical protein [Algoriphagus sp. A40]